MANRVNESLQTGSWATDRIGILKYNPQNPVQMHCSGLSRYIFGKVMLVKVEMIKQGPFHVDRDK